MPDARPSDDRLRRLLELGRNLVSELDLDTVLTAIARAGTELTGARYAALGVLNEHGQGLKRFITVGVSDEDRHTIGDDPRGRGVLGVLIRDPRPLRLDDVGSHPESYGFGVGHPRMRSFLGVPIRMEHGAVFGNLYLTEKQSGPFDEDDEDVIVRLADWAAIAIDNAHRFGGLAGRRDELETAVRAFETTTEISRALAGETELSRIVELIVKRGRALVDARSAILALAEGDELVVHAGAGERADELIGTRLPRAGSLSGDVLDTGCPRRFGELPSTATMGVGRSARTAVMAPLRFRGRSLAVIAALDRTDGRQFSAEDERLLGSFALTAAPAIATAQDVAGEQRRRTIAAAERERARWARELHDQTLQDLAAVKTLLGTARRTGDAERLARAVDVAVEQLQLGITSLRSLITDLRPAALDELGIAAAIRSLASRVTSTTDLDVALELDLAFEAGRARTRHAPELEATVYRIVQEALTNVVKHAGARSAAVSVCERADRIDIVVSDDGRGCDPGAGLTGFGLAGMRERAALAGGTLAVKPADGGGTVVRARLPVHPLRAGAPRAVSAGGR